MVLGSQVSFLSFCRTVVICFVVVSGNCSAGYYCVSGASVPAPRLSSDVGSSTLTETGGDICPIGHYCLAGSSAPTRCPIGTFSGSLGLTKVKECLLCTTGMICPLTGTTVPSIPCEMGFFCPAGRSAATDVCPIGHKCASGSQFPIPCDAGTFQDRVGASSCNVCPARMFCTVGSSSPIICPVGFFCPAGSKVGFSRPCPPGTFSNRSGLELLSECSPCLPGRYCTRNASTGK